MIMIKIWSVNCNVKFNTSFAKENKEGVDYNKKINEKFLFILQFQPPLALHELHESQTSCSRFYTH